MSTGTLASLYAFENEAKLFSGIDHRVKFALLTMAGDSVHVGEADFAFGLYRADDLHEEERHFSLSASDIALFNPNTRTCPIFRSKRDVKLTKAIYSRVPVLIKDGPPEENPWGIKFSTMFHMTNDAHLFRTRGQLEVEDYLLGGNVFSKDDEKYWPLYEGKMIWHFDHRFGTYEGQTQAQANQSKLPELTAEQHADPSLLSLPHYWVHESHVSKFTQGLGKALLVFRDITNASVLRTSVFCIMPNAACGNNLPIASIDPRYSREMAYFVSCCSSFVFDYVARQKLGGTHMNFFILKQLPVLPLAWYAVTCKWDGRTYLSEWIWTRALELIYTSWDLESFVQECGYDGPPFRWYEERRFLLRCELDAAYFHLYGIERADVDYILNTFRVAKDEDEHQHGEYRTKRVILEIYDAMKQAIDAGEPYQTVVQPPPADPSLAHPSRIGINL